MKSDDSLKIAEVVNTDDLLKSWEGVKELDGVKRWVWHGSYEGVDDRGLVNLFGWLNKSVSVNWSELEK